jgi:hypothetical protein
MIYCDHFMASINHVNPLYINKYEQIHRLT